MKNNLDNNQPSSELSKNSTINKIKENLHIIAESFTEDFTIEADILISKEDAIRHYITYEIKKRYNDIDQIIQKCQNIFDKKILNKLLASEEKSYKDFLLTKAKYDDNFFHGSFLDHFLDENKNLIEILEEITTQIVSKISFKDLKKNTEDYVKNLTKEEAFSLALKRHTIIAISKKTTPYLQKFSYEELKEKSRKDLEEIITKAQLQKKQNISMIINQEKARSNQIKKDQENAFQEMQNNFASETDKILQNIKEKEDKKLLEFLQKEEREIIKFLEKKERNLIDQEKEEIVNQYYNEKKQNDLKKFYNSLRLENIKDESNERQNIEYEESKKRNNLAKNFEEKLNILTKNEVTKNNQNDHFQSLEIAEESNRNKIKNLQQGHYLDLIKTQKINIEKQKKIEQEFARNSDKLFEYAKNNQLKQLEKMLKSNIINFDIDNKNNPKANPLIAAVSNNNIKIAKLLLQKGANPNQCAFDLDENNFIFALQDPENDKADTLSKDAPRQLEVPPIFISIQKNLLEITKLLINYKADINYKIKEEINPIALSAKHYDLKILKLLLGNNNLDKKPMESGLTPIHVAADSLNFEAIKILTQNGFDINYKIHESQLTALAYLIEKLDDKEDPVFFDSKQKKIIFEYDLSQNNKNITTILVDRTADRLEMIKKMVEIGADINCQDKDGRSLHSVAFKGLIDEIKFIQKLNPNFEVKDNLGKTLLHFAAANGKNDMIKFLLNETKINIDAKDQEGTTALFLAAMAGHFTTVEILLSLGAEVNARNKNDEIAIFFPCYEFYGENSLKTIDVLIKYGADLSLKNKAGESILFYICENPRIEFNHQKLALFQKIESMTNNLIDDVKKYDDMMILAAKNNNDEIVNYLQKSLKQRLENSQNIQESNKENLRPNDRPKNQLATSSVKILGLINSSNINNLQH